MPTRDETGVHSLAPSLVPAARTAAAAVNGTGVDTSGCDTVTCYANVGVWTDGTHTFKIQDSADNSTFADLAAPASLIGAFTVVSSAPTASNNQEVGVLNCRRYVRLVVTTAGATTGAVTGGGFLLGQPGQAPIA